MIKKNNFKWKWNSKILKKLATVEIETEKKVVDVNDYDLKLLQKLQLLQFNDSSDDEYDH